MSNKKIFKELYSEKINKNNNYKIILKSIESNEIKKKKNILRFVFVPACLIIFFAIITVFFKQENSNLEVGNSKNQIHINLLKNYDEFSADIDGIWVDKTIEEVAKEFPFVYDLNIQHEYVRIGEQYAVSDSTQFSEMYDELVGYNLVYVIDEEEHKTIDIFFSETNRERKRCLSYNLDNPKISIINNTSLEIIKLNFYYIVLFEKNGIYFDIEAKNINQEELIKLLKTIVQ